MPQQVSSSTTLFLKIVFPLFWTVFFTVFTLAVWFAGETSFGTIPVEKMKIYMPIFLACGILFLYFTVMQLKRVEMDELYVYATNYFKTYRYPYHNIDTIKEKNYGLFRVVQVHFKEKGSFGKKISFLASKHRLQLFLNNNPEVAKQFLEDEKLGG